MQCSIRAIFEPINARINLPGSKKISNRALMLAALADGVSEITDINFNEYTKAFIYALQQAGINIYADPIRQSCTITGCNGKLPKAYATIWCDEVETATRYLLTACSGAAGTYYIDGSENLRKTKFEKQLQLLARQGAQITPNDNQQLPLTLIGADSLNGGELHFEKQTLSCVLTSFLILSPYARTPFSFRIPSNNKQNYIDMTCQMMAEFGVLVRRIHRGQFMVPVPQRYHARDYRIEPDLTLLAFFCAAATVSSGHIVIQPFKRSRSKQIDIKTLMIFEKLGSLLQESKQEFSITGPETIQGIDITIQKFSASVAALFCIAPFAQSPTSIHYSKIFWARKHAWLQLIEKEFKKLGIKLEVNQSQTIIYPSAVQSTELDAHNDVYLAMIFAVIGLKVSGISISNIDQLNKLYPDFLTLWDQLSEPAQFKHQA